MNKKAFSICLLLSFLMSVSAMAAPRTRAQAKLIAQTKAKALGVEMVTPTLARRSAAQTAVTDEDNAAYYVFNNGNNNGWTIVSGDDRMPEVLGYSDEGTLDLDNLPAPVQDIFKGIEKTVADLDSPNAATRAKASARRKATAYTAGLAIGPLLTTKWSQFEPYYNLTPTSSGTHCATCCVATAMAQIVYYLYCTQDGQTSTTFTNSITGTYASAAPRTYDWSSMLPGYLGTYTDAQATAVATLMRDCGYAINAAGGQITYGVGESTAYQYKTPSAYSTYFGVTGVSDTYASSQSTISDASTFFSKIDTELTNYRPVQVAGNGHSFVCDGRAADGIYYHFNFGYAGGGDGFYCAGAYNGYDQYSDMEITYGFTLSNPTKTSTGLSVAYNSAVKTAGLRPVGTIPGMYQQSYYNTLVGYLDTAKGVIDGTTTMSDANQKTLINNIGTAEQNLIKYTTPFDSGNNTSGSTYGENGTAYYIRTSESWNGYKYSMYFYTESSSIITGLYSMASSTGYKYRFFYDSSSNGYYIGNNTLTQYVNSVPGYGEDPTYTTYSSNNTLPSSADTQCEVIPTDYLGNGEFAVTLRPIASGYTDDQDRYMTAWYDDGDNNGFATSSIAPSYVQGGDPYGDSYSKWILVPAYASTTTATTGTASFANSDVKIEKGSTATQTVTTNSNGTITYSSSDITVATVNPTTGEVTAVGEGNAVITAAIGATVDYNNSGYTAVVATYNVSVTNSSKQTPTASFTTSSYTLYPAQTCTNTFNTNSDGTVTYSSSASGIATVDASGKVTAGDTEGTATITASVAATSTFNAATATYTVTVKRDDQDVTFANSSLNVVVGKTGQNVASTTGDGAITYKSSDESIATVASDGTVTGVAVGTATITATAAQTNRYHSASATYTVTVENDPALASDLANLIADAQTLYTDEELTEAQEAASQAGTPTIESSAARSISSGSYYVIGYTTNGTTYYMTSEGKSSTTLSFDNIFIFTTSGSTCKIQIYPDGNYLAYSNGIAFNSTGTNFTYSGSNGTYTFSYMSGNTNYYLKRTTTGYSISRNTSSSASLNLYKVTSITSAATEEQKAIVALDGAITTAEAVTTATQSAIDALQEKINAYYSSLTNLELVDSKAYCSTLKKEYDKATYTRTVGSNKWGTICLPYDIATDANVQLYQATEASATTLTVEKVETVAAGTPAIFKNLSDATTVTFEKANATAISCAEGKVTSTTPTMKATYRNLTNQTGMYFIANDAFWKASEPISIKTFRGWFDASTSGAKSLAIVEGDDADGISVINDNDDDNDNMYNIAGQRVVTPQKGQIVIINGKKTIVK